MNEAPKPAVEAAQRPPGGSRGRAQARERDFLPAALALQSRPPSPVGRLLAMELVVLVVIVILWMLVSKIDIHAVATGELVPVGESKWIRAPQLGLVRRILVAEGDVVERGQPLLVLDASVERFRLQQVEHEIDALAHECNRLRALRRATDDGYPPQSAIAAPPAALSEIERQRYVEALVGLNAQRDLLLLRLQHREESLQAERSTLEGLLARQPLLTRHSESLEKLFDRQMVAEQEYLQAKLSAIETGSGIAVARGRLRMQRAEIDETRRAVDNLLDTTRERWLTELAQAQPQLEQQRIERDRLSARIADLTLRAPVAGSVQEIQVHARNAVVDAAQPLLKLVPRPRVLAVSARLANKDVGFVVPGQKVKVKVDAFPYTRFGFLDGVVEGVSADSADAADNREPVSAYRLRVALPEASLRAYPRAAALTPGMRVSAEIRTGERRLIEFLLAPILRYRSESLHER